MSTRSQNHLIVWVWRVLKTHLVPTHLPATHEEGHVPLEQLFLSPSQPGLEDEILLYKAAYIIMSQLSDKKVEQCPLVFSSRRRNSATHCFSRVSLLQKSEESYIKNSHSLEWQVMISLPPSLPTLGFTTGWHIYSVTSITRKAAQRNILWTYPTTAKVSG